MNCSMTGFPVLHYLLEFPQTHVHWVSDATQPSQDLLPPSLALNLSSIRVFSNESALHIRWPKYWSFSFSISPSNEYSGLISFRIDWFDLLAVQGTIKSLLKHHSSKASVLQCSAFFMVQLWHPYKLLEKHNFWFRFLGFKIFFFVMHFGTLYIIQCIWYVYKMFSVEFLLKV